MVSPNLRQSVHTTRPPMIRHSHKKEPPKKLSLILTGKYEIRSGYTEVTLEPTFHINKKITLGQYPVFLLGVRPFLK